VVLFGDLDLVEEASVQFQSCCQVVEGLLEVPVFEVSVAELGVCGHEEKEILLVNVHEEFAECELLNTHLDDPVSILG